MISDRRRLAALLAVPALATLVLGACGRQGDLRLPERSPPPATANSGDHIPGHRIPGDQSSGDQSSGDEPREEPGT